LIANNLQLSVSNGNYYGRIKLNGKIILERLESAVWSTARLKPADLRSISPSAREISA
jgi:hypothetical protein